MQLHWLYANALPSVGELEHLQTLVSTEIQEPVLTYIKRQMMLCLYFSLIISRCPSDKSL